MLKNKYDFMQKITPQNESRCLRRSALGMPPIRAGSTTIAVTIWPSANSGMRAARSWQRSRSSMFPAVQPKR